MCFSCNAAPVTATVYLCQSPPSLGNESDSVVREYFVNLQVSEAEVEEVVVEAGALVVQGQTASL